MKVGDVVYLKSGSPLMTVARAMRIWSQDKTESRLEADCWWFLGGELQEKIFPFDTLRRRDEPTT